MFTSLIKRFLPQEYQRALHDAVYRYLGLSYVLDSGVVIDVESKTDWLVYNDVFFSGEYDEAILPLLQRHAAGATIVDLGCNTGFFTLRCLDILRRKKVGMKFNWVCVDGSAATLALFRKRVLETNRLAGQVQLVNGLIGERTGAAAFFESTNHGNNTRMARSMETGRRYTENKVKFVDLETILPHGPITLIKCDIEGSEGDFVGNYGPLLARTESLVFEFHEGHYVRQELIEKVKILGFEHRTLRTRPGTSLEYFCR